MNRMKRIFGIAAVVLVGAFSVQATAWAQIGPDANSNARQGRIVGLWDVQVTITRCDNGTPLFTFPALHKYERGGTGQVVPSTNPAALSAHMVVWNHAEGNDYQTAMKMFRFDPDGNYIGWTVVTSEVSLSADGNEYEGSGVAEFFDTGGNPVGGSCPTITGTRFTGE